MVPRTLQEKGIQAEWTPTRPIPNHPSVAAIHQYLAGTEITDSAGDFVFPGARSRQRPLSDNAVNAALRRMDIPKEEMCGHGFRATARTILAQEFHIRPDYIEHQLGHQVIDPNGRAYDRTTFLPERQLMMQEWADYLDKLKSGEEVRFNKRERLTDIRTILVGDFN
jgi:integrase